mmetsp:Transcript_12310/g.26266  ORF Transcript_12310/g.26266 Transcript_12310/m.26266 type:complete len:224 (+) Transcript_12310:130-801(+)
MIFLLFQSISQQQPHNIRMPLKIFASSPQSHRSRSPTRRTAVQLPRFPKPSFLPPANNSASFPIVHAGNHPQQRRRRRSHQLTRHARGTGTRGHTDQKMHRRRCGHGEESVIGPHGAFSQRKPRTRDGAFFGTAIDDDDFVVFVASEIDAEIIQTQQCSYRIDDAVDRTHFVEMDLIYGRSSVSVFLRVGKGGESFYGQGGDSFGDARWRCVLEHFGYFGEIA